ncbi:MAG: patatin-like phospholipase family protein [Lachnospiraceae bacterium]|nr:patatin-like phospholipase family protein [Candidatus Colinaster scatohippi]
MKKIGIVLAGGGGKGAYELGAWIAFQHIWQELDVEVEAYSGASVGALNAALFSCSTAEEADSIWSKISPSTIFNVEIIDLLKLVPTPIIIRQVVELLYGTAGKDVYSRSKGKEKANDKILEEIRKIILKDGLFNRAGLIHIINQTNIREEINTKNVYASCTNCDTGKVEYKKLNSENYIDVLLASSALPFVFGREMGKYRDGGLLDNVPIMPLTPGYVDGTKCNVFIVIHLGTNDISSFEGKRFDGCKLYHIFPNESLHGLKGTLTFSQKGINKMKKQGIRETEYELYDINKIKDFLSTPVDKEMHYYHGKTYSSINELYAEIKDDSIVNTESEFKKKIDYKEKIFRINNIKITKLILKLETLSHNKIVIITSILTSILTIVGGPVAAGITAPIGLLLGPALLTVLLKLFLEFKSTDFIYDIKNDYTCIENS